MYFMNPQGEENMDDIEESGLTRTCHLCGKAQCGQRKGRVRCAYCKRIFCLQQLYKKFKIKASVEDTDFKCPRCLGICCCVCNCQKPPPHVHCKVYKVRQTKKKTPLPSQDMHPVFPPQPVISKEIVPKVEAAAANPDPSSSPTLYVPPSQQSPIPSISSPIPDQTIQNPFYNNTDIPGSMYLLAN